MIINVKITPNTYADALMVTEDLDSFAFLTNDSAFNAMTGNTQGIRFKIKPPKRAKIIAVIKLMPDC